MITGEGSAGAPGFGKTIAMAGLVGLAGGVLFGIWDSVGVLVIHAPRPVPLRDILSLSAYCVALSAIIGCLGMTAVGVATATLIRIGRYRIRDSRLAGVFIGVFALFAIYLLLTTYTLSNDILEVAEGTMVSILSGMGLAGLGVFLLNKGTNKQRLVAVGFASFFSLLVLVYGGLWVNLSLLFEEALFRPARLLANAGLLLLVSFLGFGLYVLARSAWGRYDPRGRSQAGLVLLAFTVCGSLIMSFVGPLSFENSPGAGASPGDKIGAVAGPDIVGERPNILWIVMDTVRADHLSSYGYRRDTSPNIDRIASEGILFENTISAAPWTLPSHASMFTGMFPSKHGADVEHLWLDDEFDTIAEVLRSYGYQTFGYTNNSHAGPLTNANQGFDAFEVTSYGKVEAGSELSDHLMIYDLRRRIRDLLLIKRTFFVDKGAHRANQFVKRWITDSSSDPAPFFVFINYMEAHAPWSPPKDFLAPYVGDAKPGDVLRLAPLDIYEHVFGQVKVDEHGFKLHRALYDGEISYMDFKMGELFDYLREQDILDNTILIITSDHGENFGEHGLAGHFLDVNDPLIRVPLIIRYPGLVGAGVRVDEQVQLTDIFPTILDLLDIDWDGLTELQGRSLVREREGDEASFAVAEYGMNHFEAVRAVDYTRSYDVTTIIRRLKTVRTDEFKYVWTSDGRDELYEISQDPGELNNLIASEPEKAQEMKDLLDEWLGSFESYRARIARETQTTTATARR